jgi:hypothetical protein
VPTSSTPPAMSWPCVIDPTRPCGLCAAPTQELCPYPYLLEGDEPAEPVERAEPVEPAEPAEPAEPVEPVQTGQTGQTDRTSRESEAVQVPTAGPSSLT